MATAPYALELHGSRILIGCGLLDACGAEVRATLARRRLAIVSDDNVAPLYVARLAAALGAPAPDVLMVRAGEESKTREQWGRLTDALLVKGFGRDSAILALGGGVVGDLAGFVAATYMRGIPVVQVPTSLLAMIDAAVGGKTGVDTPAGKNLVGAFHHPALVLADPTLLATLPVEHLRAGLAEAVKHAVIASSADFVWLGTNADALLRDGGPDPAMAERLVRRNIQVKAEVVARDEKEAGLRKVLNFGHTIAHAVETLAEYRMLHGDCVAIGMQVEARIAVRLGVADDKLPPTVGALLGALGLPRAVPSSFAPAAILEATRRDKKARAGAVEYALPAGIGSMAGADSGHAIAVPDDVVIAALTDSRGR